LAAVVREYKERLSEYGPVLFDMVDLREFIGIMCDQFAASDYRLSINVDEGRTKTRYDSLAAFETDTTLPNFIRQMTIHVASLFDKSPKLEIDFYAFSSSTSTEISGTDETLVLGQKQRLEEFVRKRKRGEGSIAKFFKSWWLPLVFYVLPANIIVQGMWYSKHTLASAAAAIAFILFGIYGYRRPKAPPFELSIRAVTDPGGRRVAMSVAEISILVVGVVAIVVAILAWLYPHVPH
jgi:hypothetical protein